MSAPGKGKFSFFLRSFWKLTLSLRLVYKVVRCRMAAAIFIARIGSSLRMNLPMEQDRTKRMAEKWKHSEVPDGIVNLWIKIPLDFSTSGRLSLSCYLEHLICLFGNISRVATSMLGTIIDISNTERWMKYVS